MATKTASPTKHHPEWIQKASTVIAGMVHKSLAAAENEKAKIQKDAGHAESAMHEKVDSARATMKGDAQKTKTALGQSAAHVKQSVHETEQKIADVIHRHFQNHK